MLSHTAPYINVCVGLMSSEAGWSCVFLIEHRFCGGPLDRKSSDPGDRIGVGLSRTLRDAIVQRGAREADR